MDPWNRTIVKVRSTASNWELSIHDKEQLFSGLVDQCGNAAYRFAYRLCGNDSDAGDLVQEAFMKALENIDDYDPSKPFQPWLNTILRHLYLDSVKRYERKKSVSLDAPTPSGDETWSDIFPDGRPGPLDNLSSKELEVAVQRALNLIERDYRTAVVLADIEGRSYEEIGEIMGCPLGTVRSRIHRGRMILKRILEPLMEDKEVRPL